MIKVWADHAWDGHTGSGKPEPLKDEINRLACKKVQFRSHYED